jgi:biofilm protein TabA
MALFGLLDDVIRRYPGEDNVRRGLQWLRGAAAGFPDSAGPGFSDRVEIEGDRLFALRQAYLTKSPAEARFEAHRLHVDLQYVVRGSEIIRVAPISAGRLVEPHDAAKDIAFFEADGFSEILLRPGMVAVLYPEDLHAPSIGPADSSPVAKIVVKVRLPLL